MRSVPTSSNRYRELAFCVKFNFNFKMLIDTAAIATFRTILLFFMNETLLSNDA